MKSKLIKLPFKTFLKLGAFLVLMLLPVMWANAKINSPTKQDPIQFVSANGVTISLMSINVKSSRVEPTICIDLPDNGDWLPYAYLEIEKDRVPVDVVALVNAKNPDTYQSTNRCYEFGFPTGIPNGIGEVKIVVEKLQTSLPEFLTEEMCVQAEKKLKVDYPDFAFSCDIGKQGIGFLISNKPKGMTDDQANQLIVGALTNTVEGPWEITYSVR
jgi:hypothetical protein